MQANRARGDELKCRIGDFVLLNMKNQRREYRWKRDRQMAKLMLRFDAKYRITATYPETPIYTIAMPNSIFPYTTFHASELQPYQENKVTFFPLRELPYSKPVITEDSKEEWQVEARMKITIPCHLYRIWTQS